MSRHICLLKCGRRIFAPNKCFSATMRSPHLQAQPDDQAGYMVYANTMTMLMSFYNQIMYYMKR